MPYNFYWQFHFSPFKVAEGLALFAMYQTFTVTLLPLPLEPTRMEFLETRKSQGFAFGSSTSQ
jgi:hypothetical protein